MENSKRSTRMEMFHWNRKLTDYLLNEGWQSDQGWDLVSVVLISVGNGSFCLSEMLFQPGSSSKATLFLCMWYVFMAFSLWRLQRFSFLPEFPNCVLQMHWNIFSPLSGIIKNLSEFMLILLLTFFWFWNVYF